MTRPFIACHKFDLEFFQRHLDDRKFLHLKLFESGKMSFLGMADELRNIHQLYSSNLCHGHSSKRHRKPQGMHLDLSHNFNVIESAITLRH